MLYKGCLETVNINNQTIPHCFNLWSKEAIGNIIYPSIVNKIDEYMVAGISPTSVRYIISRDNIINQKEVNKVN